MLQIIKAGKGKHGTEWRQVLQSAFANILP